MEEHGTEVVSRHPGVIFGCHPWLQELVRCSDGYRELKGRVERCQLVEEFKCGLLQVPFTKLILGFSLLERGLDMIGLNFLLTTSENGACYKYTETQRERERMSESEMEICTCRMLGTIDE